VAAGDTARWVIGQSESGAGTARRSHVLVKPVSAPLDTNLVIATDRRVYHLELRAADARYAAAVSWRYPQGELIALKTSTDAPAGSAPAPAALAGAPPAPPEPDLARLNFGYKLEGEAPWRPLRVFDDGRRTVIDFPANGAELPPLFLLNDRRGTAELVNYRVVGKRVVLDRLIDAAELRLGAGGHQSVVRITREALSR
jgi:type IV secretion system protein VirB9